jgi:hypothetical protein
MSNKELKKAFEAVPASHFLLGDQLRQQAR